VKFVTSIGVIVKNTVFQHQNIRTSCGLPLMGRLTDWSPLDGQEFHPIW